MQPCPTYKGTMSPTENLNPPADIQVSGVGAYGAQVQAKDKVEDSQFPLSRILQALLLTLYHYCIIHRCESTCMMCGGRLIWSANNYVRRLNKQLT